MLILTVNPFMDGEQVDSHILFPVGNNCLGWGSGFSPTLLSIIGSENHYSLANHVEYLAEIVQMQT